ncbi:MAG: BamA/TamA family outer membrane protein [Candidatus Cloacimonetes bacterium]|nr:BamA/TamA family outer membrane protein [Candidatus Cloacimonadota bacterium]
MKALSLALLMILAWAEVYAISIGSISIEADFPIDEAKLIEVLDIGTGDEYLSEAVETGIVRLKEYFALQHKYYLQIAMPELLPLPDGSLELLFRIERLTDSDKVRIHYTGLKYFSQSKLHEYAFSSEQALYDMGDLEEIMASVLHVYQQRGYLFAAVELDSLVMGDPLVAYIKVEEGDQQRISGFRFRGNKVSRESTLLKTSGLLRQKVITPQILNQAAENIKRRDYINSCRIIPLDEENLLIDIEEGRMTFLEGLLGISENDGKRQLSGMLNLEFLNLWGSDRSIKLFWKKSPADYSELRFAYHESGIPSLPLAADLALSRTRQDSLWISSVADLDLYYQSLYQRIGLSLGANSVLPGSSDSEIEKSTNSSLGAFWRFQSTGGERIPVRGLEMEASYDYVFGDGATYGKTRALLGYYLPIKARLIAFMGANYLNNEKRHPASYDLYSMGGYASLRGYREDEFKSSRLAWTNLELRYMLAAETMIYTFYDQGYMHSREEDPVYDLWGIGAGIKLGTRLGILSIEYGLGYRDKSFSSLGLGMIHLGVDIAL